MKFHARATVRQKNQTKELGGVEYFFSRSVTVDTEDAASGPKRFVYYQQKD